MTTNEDTPTHDDGRHRLADDFVSVEAVCAALRSYADDREDARENEDDVFEADYARAILASIESSSWLSARVAAAVTAERERLMGIRVPVNGEPGGSISLTEFEQAYIPYGKRFSQSAERICERGGFGWAELTDQLGHEPTSWRPIPGDRLAYQSQRNRDARVARSGS
jgi:hypothetical protein